MKAIAATAFLFFIAGVCFAGPQPCQRRSNVIDILTYNNVSNQKTGRCTGPKIYAPTQENTGMGVTTAASSIPAAPSTAPAQTFTPSPVMNSYKEFR